jgi:hypothetical protein
MIILLTINLYPANVVKGLAGSCVVLALLAAHHIFHISRIKVNMIIKIRYYEY